MDFHLASYSSYVIAIPYNTMGWIGSMPMVFLIIINLKLFLDL